MTIAALEELTAAKLTRPTALTLGVFDGVHLGHRYLINALRRSARQLGLASTVLFFKNHPRTVLQPATPHLYLSSPEERALLLRFTGAEQIVPLTFSTELAQLTPEQFVAALVERAHMQVLVVGPDFALGKERAGTIPVLRDLGTKHGFQVRIQEAYTEAGQVVSSTAVRENIVLGQVRHAAQMLGRPYRLRGVVVKGDQRGQSLGFPTANLDIPRQFAVPANGIYSTLIHIDGKRHPSVTSIGTRPTFDGTDRRIESFVLDFSGDLYGQELILELIEHQRPELRFESVDALVAQMQRDVEIARSILSTQPR